MKSKVYLTGAGPGDPSLISIKALELIKIADCIIYDYLVNPGLLKFRKKGCELVYAGKKAGAHTLSQDKINRLLVKKAKTFRHILRLKGGDPFIFGRGAEEAEYLKEKNIDFEIVPGITSAIAVPAYAGIPLTERNKTSTVGFITGHEDPAKTDSSIDWAALVKALGTMVFLMGVGNLELIVKKLIESGKPKKTPVAVIRRGATSEQKTVTGSLANIVRLVKANKMAPPALIVVGEVVKLRKKLNWFEKKPLFGKRIIVTRARHQAGVFSEKLIALGADVIEIPVIDIVSLKADRQLFGALSRDKYDWIFFTSQNGVAEFSEILKRIGKDSRILAGANICAIGTETAISLAKIGIKADYVPKCFYAEEIVRYFKDKKSSLSPFPKALILRARQGRDILPDGLRKSGLTVKVIDLYDTRPEKRSAPSIDEALKIGVDIITFTSSSTVRNFIKLLGKGYKLRLSKVRLASIGPVTSKTLKEFGLKADIEAKVFTTNGLTEAISRK